MCELEIRLMTKVNMWSSNSSTLNQLHFLLRLSNFPLNIASISEYQSLNLSRENLSIKPGLGETTRCPADLELLCH